MKNHPRENSTQMRTLTRYQEVRATSRTFAEKARHAGQPVNVQTLLARESIILFVAAFRSVCGMLADPRYQTMILENQTVWAMPLEMKGPRCVMGFLSNFFPFANEN